MNWRDPKRWRDIVLGAGLLFGVAACTWQGIKPDSAVTRHLYIAGQAAHVDDQHIAAIAAPYLDASFFDVDIQGLQSELASQPWLAQVSVSRHWPGGVVVRVAEHKPVALWGRHGVLAADGSVFTPAADTRPSGLVQLDGPDAAAALKVYHAYQKAKTILFGHGVHIARLTLNARGSWHATLGNGLRLRLGRDALAARMQRFVDYALASSAARAAVAQAGYVDLRYSDGFAVGGTRASGHATDKTRENGNDQAA